MQVNAVNFEQVKTNYMTKTVATPQREEAAKPQMKEAYSSDASMAIKNTMVAGIKINKPEALENKELKISGDSTRAQGKMTDDFRSYERGRFEVNDGYVLSGEAAFPDTKINAGELVMYGDNGRRIATGMDGVTNKFQAEAKKDTEAISINDSVVKSGVRFNEVEEKYGDYAIMDENGLVNFYDKEDNNIGSMKAVVRK